MILTGDCVERMAEMAENSVDAIVTDPPYGLEFMGKEWDKLAKILPASEGYSRPGSRAKTSPMETWGNRPSGYVAGPPMQQFHARWATEALRVLKPGHYLLAFGGTRTVHRLTVALEDSGWIIRDMLIWAYASGFPKSKATLKPAYEPIVLAKKPGPMVPLGIDAARIPFTGPDDVEFTASRARNWTGRRDDGPAAINVGEAKVYDPSPGRWPSNLILTSPLFDGDTPGVVGGGQAGGGFGVRGGGAAGDWNPTDRTTSAGQTIRGGGETVGYGDTGTYSRFFLLPKASRVDREPNAYGRMVGGLEPVEVTRESSTWADIDDPRMDRPTARKARINQHPTTKPVALLRHLVRLVVPVGGTCLDPFAGSGTTGLACELEGFDYTLIERESEYVKIIEARLAGVQRGLGLDVAAPVPQASTKSGSRIGEYQGSRSWSGQYGPVSKPIVGDEGTPSRFFMLPRDPLDDEAA